MKAIPVAIVAILLVSSSVGAVCTQQAAAVFHINGVDADKREAEKSQIQLGVEVTKKLTVTQVDCTSFDLAYNKNELLFLDFLESGLQKAAEEVGSVEAFWESYFRSFTARHFPLFDLLVRTLFGKVNTSIQAGTYVLGNQVEEHLAKYLAAFALNHRVILVGHSQGNLYANEEWNRLSAAQRGQTRVIAVATPDDFVAGNGPYTTLFRDSLAASLFIPILGALPANTAIDEGCQDEFLGFLPAPWLCHGFKEAYLFGTKPRNRIVDQIVAALPASIQDATIQGHTFRQLPFGGAIVVEGGVTVRLFNSDPQVFLIETTSDGSGFYSMRVPLCTQCFIEATKFISNENLHYGGFSPDFEIIPVVTYTIDVTMPPPPIFEEQ